MFTYSNQTRPSRQGNPPHRHSPSSYRYTDLQSGRRIGHRRKELRIRQGDCEVAFERSKILLRMKVQNNKAKQNQLRQVKQLLLLRQNV